MRKGWRLVEMRSLHEKDGFTLLELVLVVAVLAILAALAIPRFICLVPFSRATAAYYSIKQILRECEVRRTIGADYKFTGDELDGYTVSSGTPSDCNGDPSSGLISVIPANTNDYPRFDLNPSTGLISCIFKGSSYQQPILCLDLICGEGSSADMLPPNSSVLFSKDSGLSCRAVDSNQIGFGYGHVYLDGRDEVELEIQPVTIKAGGEEWDISGVRTTIRREPCYATNDRCSDDQWLLDFANAVVDTVNNSESSYSAEIDTSGNGQIKFYSPSGEVEEAVTMEVSRQIIDAPWNSAANGTNPWAYPSLGGDVITDTKYYGNRVFGSDQSSENATQTTICDGK